MLISEGVKSGHYLYFVESGTLLAKTESTSQIVYRNQVAWLGAGTVRELLARGSASWMVLRLRNRTFSAGNPADRIAWETVLRMGILCRENPRLFLTRGTVTRLFTLARGMVEWGGKGSLASIPMLKAALLQIVANLLADRLSGKSLQQVELPGMESGLLQRALLLIDEQAESIQTIADLAKDLGTSRSGLYRIFAAAGLPGPAHLLERSRIERAGQLLRSSDRTILDIALSTGFSSLSAFYRAFHRVHGVAPGEWRT